MLTIKKTLDPASQPPVMMLVYGEGGVGKTTFSSTAPKPLLADCEGGSKYFGLRGIAMDVVQITNWSDMKDFIAVAKAGGYETIVIDPIGELMDKLKRHLIGTNDSKLVQKDGSPTMAGWGWLKTTMRSYIKVLRDSGLHVLIIAHVDEKTDEDRIIKEPMVETKLKKELVNIMDIVGYMTVVQEEGVSKRVIIVDPESDKYTAKDRTGQLGKYVEPDFTKIVKAASGTETFAWSSPEAVKRVETSAKVPEAKEPPKTHPLAVGEPTGADGEDMPPGFLDTTKEDGVQKLAQEFGGEEVPPAKITPKKADMPILGDNPTPQRSKMLGSFTKAKAKAQTEEETV